MQQGAAALQIPADLCGPTASRSSVTHTHLQWNHPAIVTTLTPPAWEQQRPQGDSSGPRNLCLFSLKVTVQMRGSALTQLVPPMEKTHPPFTCHAAAGHVHTMCQALLRERGG